MKTAYELAMERLGRQAPAVTLTDAQKAGIAELESRHRAKLAELELAVADEIAKALGAGNPEGADESRQRLAHERRKLQEELERRKAAVREGGRA